jgi:hypothetical protein
MAIVRMLRVAALPDRSETVQRIGGPYLLFDRFVRRFRVESEPRLVWVVGFLRERTKVLSLSNLELYDPLGVRQGRYRTEHWQEPKKITVPCLAFDVIVGRKELVE